MRTTKFLLSCAGLAAIVLAPAAPAAAQDFNWHGRVPAGQTIEIRGVNGSIDASAASGAEVEVTAVKHAHRSNPADVKIQVVPHAGGVTICTVYPGEGNDCQPGGGHSKVHDNDVSVDFTVHVPAGVKFEGVSVNGGISANGLTADVEAKTVNGSVRINTRGLAHAQTVNGGIDVVMGRTDWTGSLRFQSVNGAVRVTLPADASAEISASTVNGSLNTDFPLMVQGRFNPRHIQGTIGKGGRQLELQTVNGSIDLRKG